MTSKKPPKTELVAICKLEFYRKQKNWKFCAPERKAKDSKRRTKATNAKLNQTYNIASVPKETEPPDPAIPEKEKQQNLDEAFVEAETGTASEPDEPVVEGQDILKDVLETDTGSFYSPRWSVQRWAERRGQWPPEDTCPTFDPTRPPPCTRPAHDPTCPQPIVHDANPIFDNNYNRIQQDIYSSQNTNFHSDYPIFESNYSRQFHPSTRHLPEELEPKCGASMFYYNSNLSCHEFDVPHCEAAWGAGAAGPGWPGWAAGCAEMATRGAGPGGEDVPDGDWRLDLSSASRGSLPSESSSEFLLGAALAPHSTQIDLLLGAEPAALSGAALAAAVSRHSAALRELLHEAQRRREAPRPSDSVDEVPVRDPGPARPPDVLLAGSHRQGGDRRGPGGHGEEPRGQGEGGRGRGRLRVAIRMGRPYRL